MAKTSKTTKPPVTNDAPISEVEDSAGVRFPPPLMVLTSILTAYAIDYEWPLAVTDNIYRTDIGSFLIASGLCLILVTALHFRKAKTSILPHKKTSLIMRHGVYAYSRNPIYLGFLIIQCGIGLWLNSLWVIGFLLISYFLLRKAVIDREETYLTRKFGQDYKDYLKQVRRWL